MAPVWKKRRSYNYTITDYKECNRIYPPEKKNRGKNYDNEERRKVGSKGNSRKHTIEGKQVGFCVNNKKMNCFGMEKKEV